jgi:thiol:disulfide interchange protein DsbG
MKNKLFSIASLIAFVIGVIVTVLVYQFMDRANVDKSKALIEKLSQGNVTIVSNFDAIGGLEGFVVQGNDANSQQGIIYTDRQGNYLISGVVIDSNGNNIAQQDFEKYIAPNTANTAYANISMTTYVQQGNANAPHKMYAVMDPNCIFCHKLYMALQPYVQSGQLSVRWIVAGFLKSSSQGKALAILGASNPVAALAQNESNFNDSIEEGGIAPMNNPSAAVKAQFTNNMKFVVKSQISATPVILYKDQNGNSKMSMGGPDAAHLDAFINSLSSQF